MSGADPGPRNIPFLSFETGHAESHRARRLFFGESGRFTAAKRGWAVPGERKHGGWTPG